MSPIPDPHTHLQPFAATGELERPIVVLTGGPWAGRVVVRRHRFRGRMRDRFAISAGWHGPPMHGFPPAPAIADREDLLLVEDLELARAVAQAAIVELRAARVPDLRTLARRLKLRE